MPAAEGLGAFTFVLSYVVKTRSPIQTGAGGTGVWLPCKKTENYHLYFCAKTRLEVFHKNGIKSNRFQR